MRFHFHLVLLLLISFSACRKTDPVDRKASDKFENAVRHAKGLAIFRHEGFSIVKVSDPWPNATKDYTYILLKENGKIPDSLKSFPVINVPVKCIIATSTTHIPSLEMLGVENTLAGFPNLDYISSPKVRTMIDQDKIRDLGSNQTLNTEIIIDISPDVIVGYGIDNSNPTLDNLTRSGLKIMLNGDWNEQTPLGKAEWIKFFGELYGLEAKADSIFSTIESEYNKTLALAKTVKSKPTVLSGAVFENRWYLPQGNSWGALTVKDAGGNYLWADSKGTGSHSLPFESVLEKAKDADYWVGPGQFTSLKEMTDNNPHYSQFKAFRNKKVYSFSSKKGATGGIVYFELAPNRPDLVLKDVLKILHPELLPDYQLYFFEQLR